MTTLIEKWTDQIVNVLTNDGRIIVGILKTYDQALNVVLEQSHERVYSPDAPVEQVPRGVIMIRGDNITTIGLLDEDADLGIDFETTRGQYLKPIVH